jgi:molybdopterin molybdotransferase
MPLIARLAGRTDLIDSRRVAQLAAPVEANGPRDHYMRATLKKNAAGENLVTPARSQDSSLLSLLTTADCLIMRPTNAPALKAGDDVPILDLDF